VSETYTDKVMDHFMNPRNVGEIDDADGVGQVGNPVCGDVMRIYFKLDGDRIADVKFKTFGCGAAIATTSILTELVLGKTIEEALQVSNREVAEALGGLPPRKMHCSNLAADAFLSAVNDYRARNGLEPLGEPSTHDEHGHEAAAEGEGEELRPQHQCTLCVAEKCPAELGDVAEEAKPAQ